MRIVRLQAENVMRLKAVDIAPTGDLVVVGGKNNAGKSSCLDAIEMALGGEARTPAQPVRRGEEAGKVILDLGDLVVTRTYGEAGQRKLVVQNKDGAKFASPQGMLDRLYGALAFDPLAFERLDPKPAAELLRKLVGLDTADLDTARASVYEERTLKNRDVKALQVTADATERFLGVPDEEVSIDAVSKEMLEAERCRRLADEAERDVEKSDDRLARFGILRAELAGEIATLQERLVEVDSSLVDAERDLDARQITAEAARMVVPNVEAIRKRLAEAETTNVQVRSNRQHAAAVRMLQDAQADAEALTGRLDALDAQKAARLAAAAFPVPGLGVGDEGVLLDGLPFEQASTSDRLRVSVAIGLAMHKDLRVLLVRDGSLLGDEKIALLATMAEEADCQVWLERMQEAPDGRTTVFISDGEVVK